MCSILGIAGDFAPGTLSETIKNMGGTMSHRGPDQTGEATGSEFGFQHNRLSIIDPENGIQPMRVNCGGYTYTLIYNGELYNTDELRAKLIAEGVEFKTHCDTEVVLNAYVRWGERCSCAFNGIFAFAVYDEKEHKIFLSRDRFGVKPLFYTQQKGLFIFSSEIKAILKHPDIRARMDIEGLWQLLYLLPVREAGQTVFKDIYEVPPACNAVYKDNKLKIYPYWELKAVICRDSEGEAVEKTRFLLSDAIRRQLVSDVPLCTLLSGGLDSSVITAVAAKHYRENGMRLSSYSFEYEGNKEFFSDTLFQPQSDDAYAAYLADYLGTKHTILTVQTNEVAGLLCDAARFRDWPGMADIDSSLLYFCRMIAKDHKVAISGECSDEVFGGYPWFYRPEMLNREFFPWIHDPFRRAQLFRPDIVVEADAYGYAKDVYERSKKSCPIHPEDSETMIKSRIASWLSINYFMSSLLERKDRMSMAASLEVRVPFADHRLVEYVYNVPWEIKFKNGVEKYLLREAMKDYLPEKILNRKKSPYPKTHNPAFEQRVDMLLKERMETSPVLRNLLIPDALEKLNAQGNETWFGQLMGRPQLKAWLLQFDCWFLHYNIELV